MSLLTLTLCLFLAFGMWLRFLCLAPTLRPSASLQLHLLHHLPPATVPCIPQNWECCLPFTHFSLCLKGPSFCLTCPPPSSPSSRHLPRAQTGSLAPLFVTSSPSAHGHLGPLPSVLSPAGWLFLSSFTSPLSGR